MNEHDRNLLARIQRGEEPAFEAVFREFYPVLVNFARRFVYAEEDAEELVQDLFTRMWDKREQLTLTTSLKAYLFTAVRNSGLNYVRNQKVRQGYREQAEAAYREPGQKDLADDASVLLERAEMGARIDAAVGELPPRCREVFVLSRFEGLKYQEIADQMGISPRTVEVQIGKALRLLRASLGDLLFLLFVLGLIG